MFAIKFIPAHLDGSADEADLPWEAVPGHADYADEAEAWEACREFDAGFDGRYVHRAFEVANDTITETEEA